MMLSEFRYELTLFDDRHCRSKCFDLINTSQISRKFGERAWEVHDDDGGVMNKFDRYEIHKVSTIGGMDVASERVAWGSIVVVHDRKSIGRSRALLKTVRRTR